MDEPHILLYFLVVIGAIAVWYLFQIGSRKRVELWFRTKRALVAVSAYIVVAVVLVQQRLPLWQVILISGFAGMGCGWLLVKPPKEERRIPKAIRRAVIARDLTSKGLTWDPIKYHIDHIVPLSRGGDHSVRNLRVIEREKNLRRRHYASIPRFPAVTGNTPHGKRAAVWRTCIARFARPQILAKRRQANVEQNDSMGQCRCDCFCVYLGDADSPRSDWAEPHSRGSGCSTAIGAGSKSQTLSNVCQNAK